MALSKIYTITEEEMQELIDLISDLADDTYELRRLAEVASENTDKVYDLIRSIEDSNVKDK